MLDVHLQLTIHLQLSIHMLDVDLQLTIHLQLAIYLHTGFPACMLDVCLSDWRTAFICRWAEYYFCWRVLILELVAGDGKVFWGLRKRWMAVDVARFWALDAEMKLLRCW